MESRYEETRSAWIKNTSAEGRLWLQHIKNKVKEISILQSKVQIPIFEEAELLFHIFSFLNWLAHIDLQEDHRVQEKDMVLWLETVTTWPPDVCRALWFCVRNPVMHTGRAFIFSDYKRKTIGGQKLYAGFHPDMNFDPLAFQPAEFKPTESEDGYSAATNPFEENGFQVNFFIPGVLRKLDIALVHVLENIKIADDQTLLSLRKVNAKLLGFRAIG